jgi:hypothetical protein
MSLKNPVIIEAPSMFQARMTAVVRRLARRFDFSAVKGVVICFLLGGGCPRRLRPLRRDARPRRLCILRRGATFDFSAVTGVVGDFRFCSAAHLAGFLFLAFATGRAAAFTSARRASSATFASAARRRASSAALAFCGAVGGLGTLDQLLACKALVEYALFVRLGRATWAWSAVLAVPWLPRRADRCGCREPRASPRP